RGFRPGPRMASHLLFALHRAALRLAVGGAHLVHALALAGVLALALVVCRRARALALARVGPHTLDLVAPGLLVASLRGDGPEEKHPRRGTRDEHTLRHSIHSTTPPRSNWFRTRSFYGGTVGRLYESAHRPGLGGCLSANPGGLLQVLPGRHHASRSH